MIDFLGYFRPNDEDDFFSSVIGVAALFALLDMFVRNGLLRIDIPSGIVQFEISLAMEIILKTAPTIIMILQYATLGILFSRNISERKYGPLMSIVIMHSSGYVCFLYFLYCFFSNFESIFIEPPLEGTVLENHILQIVLKISPYYRTFILFIGAFSIKMVQLSEKYRNVMDENPFGEGVVYNTFTYEFENRLTEKQIQMINEFVQKPLDVNDSDSGFNKIEKLSLKRHIYKEIFNDRLIIGLFTDDDEYVPFRKFEKYICLVNEELLRIGCKYLMTVNNEKYCKIRILDIDNGEQENTQLVRVGK